MKNNQYAMTPMLYATTMQIFAFVILVLSKKKAYRDTALLDEHQAGTGVRNSSSQRRSESKHIDRKGSYTKASTSYTPSSQEKGPHEGRLDLSTSTPYRPHHHHNNIIQAQIHNHSNSNLLNSTSKQDSSEPYVQQTTRRLTVPDEPSVVTSEVSRGDDSIPEESKMEISKSGYGTPLGPTSSVSAKTSTASPTTNNRTTATVLLPSPPEPEPDDTLQTSDRPPALEKDKETEHHDVWVH
jgi:hypothetical protein